MFSELVEGLMGLPDTALDDRIREIELARRRLDAELAAAVVVAERRQLGGDDGHRTINACLRATINCSTNEASRLRSLGAGCRSDRRARRPLAGGSVRDLPSSTVLGAQREPSGP